MKFGKRMRGLATKEWANSYVDYKHLKRQIRQLQSEQQHAHSVTTIDTTETTFLSLLALEMDKLNATHARIEAQLEVTDLGALQRALGNRWVLARPKARSLLLDAIELAQRVDALRRYVVLNSLALVKIAKKCDKMLGTQVRPAVLDALRTQSFYNAAGLDRVCAATAALTDRLMLCILPDGNHRIDATAVACPICLCADVKTPISLRCGHAFCWSCLSKAAEHRFHSCPLCRTAQSLDPRYYEIDGLLKRFQRAYAFAERGLDRAPLASSPMRQILAEAFALVAAHLDAIDAQYAAVSPPASLCGDMRESTASEVSRNSATDSHSTSVSATKTMDAVDKLFATAASITDGVNAEIDDASAASAPEDDLLDEEFVVFERGDPVEILASDGVWCPGMIMQCNDDATYSVLWWVHDNSQRFGQKVAHAQLREPVFADDGDESGTSSVLYDVAADAWRTATEWALEPFRRLRSFSSSTERVVSS